MTFLYEKIEFFRREKIIIMTTKTYDIIIIFEKRGAKNKK